MYLDWHHTSSRRGFSFYMQYRARIKSFDDEEVHKRVVKEYERLFVKVMNQFETLWLRNSPYIGGFEEMTIADLSAACEMYMLNIQGIEIDKWPKTKKWLDHMVFDVPEMKEVHSVIMEAVERRKKKKSGPKL